MRYGEVVDPSTPHFESAKLLGGGDSIGGAAACAGTLSAAAPVAAPSASARPEIAARSMWPSRERRFVELHGWRRRDHAVSSDRPSQSVTTHTRGIPKVEPPNGDGHRDRAGARPGAVSP